MQRASVPLSASQLHTLCGHLPPTNHSSFSFISTATGKVTNTTLPKAPHLKNPSCRTVTPSVLPIGSVPTKTHAEA